MDRVHYEKGHKHYKFFVGDKEYDPFEFKESVMNIYKPYFQIK